MPDKYVFVNILAYGPHLISFIFTSYARNNTLFLPKLDEMGPHNFGRCSGTKWGSPGRILKTTKWKNETAIAMYNKVKEQSIHEAFKISDQENIASTKKYGVIAA